MYAIKYKINLMIILQRHEKEEMNKKLIETQSDADRLIAELKVQLNWKVL